MWVQICGVEEVIREWGWDNRLWEMGQLNHSMGLEWREVCPLHQMPPCRVRFFAFGSPQINCHTLYNIVLCCIYFSPLQVKNKPCEGFMKYAFILGPFSLVANMTGGKRQGVGELMQALLSTGTLYFTPTWTS
jgi:hypothetical protein